MLGDSTGIGKPLLANKNGRGSRPFLSYQAKKSDYRFRLLFEHELNLIGVHIHGDFAAPR